MIKTFTPVNENDLLLPEKVLSVILESKDAEPSVHLINRILSFSKNLEVKPSSLMENISYLRS